MKVWKNSSWCAPCRQRTGYRPPEDVRIAVFGVELVGGLILNGGDKFVGEGLAVDVENVGDRRVFLNLVPDSHQQVGLARPLGP